VVFQRNRLSADDLVWALEACAMSGTLGSKRLRGVSRDWGDRDGIDITDRPLAAWVP
jgi:hypothetical protein